MAGQAALEVGLRVGEGTLNRAMPIAELLPKTSYLSEADRAVDKIRDRFGWNAIGYGSTVLGISRSVPLRTRGSATTE